MNTLKTLAADTSSKETLDFIKEESWRQTARDVFLKIMVALVQHLHPVVTSPVIPPMSEYRNQFRYGMTNFRPYLSMVFHQGYTPQDLGGYQQDTHV